MEKSRRGIQSIEIGSALLLQLARHVRPIPLKDLAKAAGMTAGKAHPYMVSFLNVGFVTQTDAGHYELGPLALQLGLARLQRMDPVKEASQQIEALANDTGQSVAVAVWGNLGPTIVRLEEPIEPLHVNLRTGTVMSLANTATGRLFAAYMPPKVVEHLLSDELARLSKGVNSKIPVVHEVLEASLAETRKHGLSRSLGQPIPGIDALCAPVFDSAGHIVLGILVMGPSATFDSSWDGAVATPLLRCALEVSRRVGHN
ncbi:IclR family transcriptional regulator [Rhodoferax sediminis]|uniref:IclR family transcriptional regulator n=1 Tax=Rhodoferax sediminis TaxID=2509614 RepID=A0A515DH92_9BURK|nr:IclR family transcriptional regulator [Rhodoferax sediminis]QDL39793.1 IclR family transcriptional regulator [Rhodoferax sediminis]